jgi:hypothetical protein
VRVEIGVTYMKRNFSVPIKLKMHIPFDQRTDFLTFIFIHIYLKISKRKLFFDASLFIIGKNLKRLSIGLGTG